MDIEIEQADFLIEDLVCSVCFAEFLDKEDLVIHVNTLHLNEASKCRFCKLCTQIFPDVGEYALHLRNNHFGNIKCCKYCTRLFKSTLELQEHEKRHNITTLYPRISCSHCNHVFDNKNEVIRHEVEEHIDSDDGFILTDYLPVLSSVLCMNINEFLAAMQSNLPYICVKCAITTLDINIYIQHLIDSECHCTACNECCNVYAAKYSLRIHMRKHFYDNNVPKLKMVKKQCPKCKVTLRPALFMAHLKGCTGMRCEQCNLSFDSVTEYTNHRTEMHKTKSLMIEVCIYCQQQRVGANAMMKHVERAHKNEKHLYKYHCTDCNRIFKHPKLLFAHFFSKHKDLHPYTCKICDQTFKLRKNFTLHIKLTHKSVGYVKFDDNFHVFFTNEPSAKQTQCEVHQDADDKDYDTSNLGNEDENCDNTESLCEDTCQIEIEIIDDSSDDPISEAEKIVEHCVDANEPDDLKSRDYEHKIVEVNVENLQNKSENKKINCVTPNCKPIKKSVQKKILKRKRNVTKNRKNKLANEDIDVSSDDSDIPLKIICQKMKMQKSKISRACRMPWKESSKTKNFICSMCKRNCYTFQNYHRHLALHTKNERKVCIKCLKEFISVKKLNEHIKKEHSTSKLTETLKKLLEKRKNANVKSIGIAKVQEDVPLDIPLSTTEKFRRTIKKVNFEKCLTKATMQLVDRDKISVKKYLENFTPENNELKITMFNTTIDSVKRLRPYIKLTKFTPEPIQQMQGVTLKMPVKFTDDFNEKCQASIKLVTDYEPPSMRFDSPVDSLVEGTYINTYDDCDSQNSFEVEAEKDVIPDVAQEVMLVGTEECNGSVYNTGNKAAWHNFKIAHLTTEAPYFKISKLNIDKDFPQASRESEMDVPKKITLTNGKKFVNANPFAHLIDKRTIDNLKKSKKKYAYKPKLKNVAEAITKAMEKLENTPYQEKKKM